MEVEAGGRLCSCFPTLRMWTRIDIAQADRAEPLQHWNLASVPEPKSPNDIRRSIPVWGICILKYMDIHIRRGRPLRLSR
jgi:hypothetical protein